MTVASHLGPVPLDEEGTPFASRLEVRRLLDKVLVHDPDFDALCIDHFSQVARLLAAGMDRRSKVNLLLLHHEPAEILQALQKSHPKLVAEHLTLFDQGDETPEARAAHLLGRQLKKLSLERIKILARGGDTGPLEQEIARFRREQRQGPQLQESEELSNRYHLTELCGRGGFANVWQAYDYELEDFVAVKVLHTDQVSTQNLQRFADGARKMTSLSHRGIVRVLAAPSRDHGFHYFVMEYISGGDLSQAVRQGLAWEHALHAILQAGEALEFAHQRGIVHRDVKPANILLDATGNAKLTDFDLARGTIDSHGTRTGAMGTFIYAAPEELENARTVDRRADVYSLGMTALFALHGKELPSRAFQNGDWFIKQLKCSDSLKAVLARAVSWEVEERYATIAEFCACLKAALCAEPEPEIRAKVSPRAPRNRLPMLGLGLGLLSSIAGIGAGLEIWKYRLQLVRQHGPQLHREEPAMKDPARATAPGPVNPEVVKAALPTEPPPLAESAAKDAAQKKPPLKKIARSAALSKSVPSHPPKVPPLQLPASTATRVAIKPAVGALMKISTDDDPPLPREIQQAHSTESSVSGIYAICLNADGIVQSVEAVNGIPQADRFIIGVVRKWRYTLLTTPFCFRKELSYKIEMSIEQRVVEALKTYRVNPEQGLRSALKLTERNPNDADKAWRAIGPMACAMKKQELATQVYRMFLDDDKYRKELGAKCQRDGIELGSGK